MMIPVFIDSTQIESGGLTVGVGDSVSWQLTLRCADEGYSHVGEPLVVRGDASPHAEWPGSTLGRFPSLLRTNGAALYWEAPSAVSGSFDIAGVIIVEYDGAIPEDFPETRGRITGIQVQSRTYVLAGQRFYVPDPSRPLSFRSVERSPRWFERSEMDGPEHVEEDGLLVHLDVL